MVTIPIISFLGSVDTAEEHTFANEHTFVYSILYTV